MNQFQPGDQIVHELLPGFVMKVLDARDCETDASRPVPHLKYKIIDPERNEDWLCGYEVRPAHA